MKDRGWIREWLEAFAYAAVMALLLFFVAWPFKIEGSSMENSFFTGDRIIISRVMVWGNFVERGDLVVCRLNDTNIIKRVVGLPGDVVDILDGVVYINEEKLDEPYLKESFTPGALSVTLSREEYFVMGDNRATSVDSRESGPVPRRLLVGKTILKWFPFQQFKIY